MSASKQHAAQQRPLPPAGRHPSLSRRSLCGAFAATLLLAVGCSGKAEPERVAVYPVEGTVTFRGQPMPGAFIVLHPKTPNDKAPAPRAEVTKEGTLRVTTYNAGDGAPEGEYVLTIQWNKLVKNGADVVAGPNVVPVKYSKPETSGIVVQVAAGPNTLKPITL
jgi:hypothetical protein